MTLLVDINDQSWMSNSEFRDHLVMLKDNQIRFYPDLGQANQIKMLACDQLRSGLVKQLPNLELVQKLGAGVETIVNDPDLPEGVRVTRLKPKVVAMEMAQYALAYVLWDIHNLEFYRLHQTKKYWNPKPPHDASIITVGVLGLGHIGGAVANAFSMLKFEVIGWSRHKKTMTGVDCRWGMGAIDSMLARCDYVISVLPETQKTTGFFDLSRLKSMRESAMLINIGRGSLIVETDLMMALDQNRLRHAVLDVCAEEPLPPTNPLWAHPRITITPHVSGWHLNDGLSVVGTNYQRLLNAGELLYEVNRDLGY